MMGISAEPLTKMVVVNRLIDQGDGTVTVEFLDGSVMSVTPNGLVETRPAGTHGLWERAVVMGNLIIFKPSPTTAFAFAFAQRLPV